MRFYRVAAAMEATPRDIVNADITPTHATPAPPASTEAAWAAHPPRITPPLTKRHHGSLPPLAATTPAPVPSRLTTTTIHARARAALAPPADYLLPLGTALGFLWTGLDDHPQCLSTRGWGGTERSFPNTDQVQKALYPHGCYVHHDLLS
jgi:hypothetical protein